MQQNYSLTLVVFSFNNEIYKLGGNSSMYAETFTCITSAVTKEKPLNMLLPPADV
jgi:hypothetical protein